MGQLTKADTELIMDKAEQIDYGTIELEFKNGICMAIIAKGRTLTTKGKEVLKKRKAN
jgi:hypothetical protein